MACRTTSSRGRSTLRAALAAAFVLAGAAAHAARGGPDAYGYTWRDSFEPGFTYAWVDITGVGTDITVQADDANLGFQPLSFAMPYYGGLYTQVAASNNGWVSLVDGTSAAFTNGTLPALAAPTGIIAAFWDDLDTRAAGLILFADLGTSAVVTFKEVPKRLEPTSAHTFQVVLHDDGRIVVQYQEMIGDTSSATLGIESPDEANGLTVFSNSTTVPTTAYAVEFNPPAPIPVNLDCAAPPALSCGQVVTGDLATGLAGQDAYRCTLADYSGREHVYALDVPAPTTLRVVLETLSGNPDVIALLGCDPERCTSPPGDLVELTSFSGTLLVVVDSRPGEEGSYRLRVDCLPLPVDVSCASASTLQCGDSVTGDLRSGLARQDVYWCSTTEYSGREQVYVVDVPTVQTLRIQLTPAGGNPDLIVLNGCDPSDCAALPGDSVVLTDVTGQFVIVVDSRPGDEGPYELSVECLADSFPFCGGGLLETDAFSGSGNWRVLGWLYPTDTHDMALRVDGTTTYDSAGDCPRFTATSFGVLPPGGPGFVTWEAPDGRVDVTLAETYSGACCGLLVTMRVTNTGTAPHFYDFRAYHDTAFGNGNGTCTTGTVDGGQIEVDGVRYSNEVELLALGADSCEGQVQMYSAEDTASIRASYQMLPPNLPTDMEFADWDDGGSPCTDWNQLYLDNEAVGNCGQDNSLLLVWRFPAGGGTLAPGESATAQYRIGWQCAWPCNLTCEPPVLSSGLARDVDPCNEGVRLSWSAAAFPAAGRGVYHVFRSTLSHADALASAALTPVAGISTTSFTDYGTTGGTQYFYVVQAESLDYPGCGSGTAVLGSTDELDLSVVTDLADVVGPATGVGNALRATGHGVSTVDFEWPLAPLPAGNEQYIVLRSDDDPQGPFVPVGATVSQAWTDPDAPPRFSPVHVWYYDVRLADSCGNVSAD